MTSEAGYRVELEQFSGPMDLLLHLLREEELSVESIPVARICDRYLAYLEDLDRIDIDDAGEFLVMASTLMRIKSRSLLPHDLADVDEDELDPRFELVRQLVEYRRFKRVADFLAERRERSAKRYPRGMRPELADLAAAPRTGEQIEDANVEALFSTFARLLRETQAGMPYVVTQDDTPMEVHIQRLGALLEPGRQVAFGELFPADATRAYVIGVFLALLELMKQERVVVTQAEAFDQIHVEGRVPPAR